MGAQTATLTWTFTGSCAAIAGASVTLTYDAINNWYLYVGPVGTCNFDLPVHDITIKLYCDAETGLTLLFSGTGATRITFEGSMDQPLVVVTEPPDPVFMTFAYLLGIADVWCTAPASSCNDGMGTVTEP